MPLKAGETIMSDTPQTDAVTDWDRFATDASYRAAIQFARQLEMALAAWEAYDGEIEVLKGQLESAEASLLEAQKNARRYEWLRKAPDGPVVFTQDYPAGYNGSPYMGLEFWWKADKWVKYTPEALDAAIDAAISKR